MSRPVTRAGAVEAAEKPDNDLELEPDPEGTGLREWFDRLDKIDVLGAAFDTRVSGPAVVTGRASKGIGRRLRHHGSVLVCAPESFLVTKETNLEPDEEDRARTWGTRAGARRRREAPDDDRELSSHFQGTGIGGVSRSVMQEAQP